MRILLTFIIAALTSGFASASLADEANVRREDQLKAAYLLNFVKFVEWPQAAVGEVLTVCFIDKSGVAEALATGIQNKKVGTRRLAVRQLEPSSGTQGCNVLYLDPQAAAAAHPLILEGKLPVLTVSDAELFTRHGGMIELFTEGNRLRFSVNVDTAQRAGLRISSSLLQLAAAVVKGSAQ